MPLQDVYKFTEAGDDRRIFVGTIETGRVRPGDEVVFLPSRKHSTVKTIEALDGPRPEEAFAGQATGLTLDTQVYAKPGELLVRADQPEPLMATRLRANIFWMNTAPFIRGRRYVLRMGAARVAAELEQVISVLDEQELESVTGAGQVERHMVAEVILRAVRPVAFDAADVLEPTSRFVIVHGWDTAGCGIVLEALEDKGRGDVTGRKFLRGEVSEQERAARYGHAGKAVVFASQSGEAAHTLAARVERRMFAEGLHSFYLSATDLGDDKDVLAREEHLGRLGEIAWSMTDAGIIFVASLGDVDRFDLDRLRRLAGPAPGVRGRHGRRGRPRRRHRADRRRRATRRRRRSAPSPPPASSPSPADGRRGRPTEAAPPAPLPLRRTPCGAPSSSLECRISTEGVDRSGCAEEESHGASRGHARVGHVVRGAGCRRRRRASPPGAGRRGASADDRSSASPAPAPAAGHHRAAGDRPRRRHRGRHRGGRRRHARRRSTPARPPSGTPPTRRLYAFVYDPGVTLVATPDDEMRGKNMRGVPDAAGKTFRDEIVSGALERGSGWEDYVYTEPDKEGLFSKSTYYELVTGSDGEKYIVCAGRYLGPVLPATHTSTAATTAQVQAFVEKAVDYAQDDGKQKALAAFTAPGGEFHDGELYIFAYDFDGTVIAHGGEPGLVGKNLIDMQRSQRPARHPGARQASRGPAPAGWPTSGRTRRTTSASSPSSGTS